jgi:hypothetical protein
VIEDVESVAGIYNHSQFMLKVVNENDQFLNTSYATDLEAMKPYLTNTTVFTPGGHFYVRADYKTEVQSSTSVPATATIDYISDNKGYSGFMTLFAQDLVQFKKLNGVINPLRIKYLALYPKNPGVSTSVNRTAFNADKIKLRIYYTRPSGSIKLN